MNDSATRQSGRGAIYLGALVAVLLLVVYPLSVGPAVWLQQKGMLPEGALVVYRPVSRTARSTQRTERLFGRYLDLWLPADLSVEVDF